jgi:hypothetical protein
MGKLGRFACIFTPMALVIAGFICLVLVLSGQMNENNKLQRDLYFFKVRPQPCGRKSRSTPQRMQILTQCKG